MIHELQPLPFLFLAPPDSDLARYLVEVLEIARRHPEVLVRIDADLDRHSLEKKWTRLEDQQWARSRTESIPDVGDRAPLGAQTLGTGRPRTSAVAVYLGLALRGYQGGFKSCDTETLLNESVTLAVVLGNLGIAPPAPGTLADLVNQVSNGTRSFIHDKQIDDVIDFEWDDMSSVLMDSTAVKGNTAWPTDSGLSLALLQRILHVGKRLARVSLPVFALPHVQSIVDEVRSIDRQISMGAGKPGADEKRLKLYQRLISLTGRARKRLASAVKDTVAALARLDVKPSLRARAQRVCARLQDDVRNLWVVESNCRTRVVDAKKVAMADKVLSTSDPDAGFIAKGGRDPVVGYRPQLARSGGGFVLGFELPRGNAADAPRLVPLFEQAVQRTGVIPHEVSVDDGYSSADGHAELLGWGVPVVSISGSKGKLITPEEDWESAEYAAARNHRSAVESLMFTIKHNFDFGRVARRGLPAVTAEMLEKILACNFCRMARCRREHQDGHGIGALAAAG